MECQINPKLNSRKKAGVSSRKRMRLTVFQKESLRTISVSDFFNMAEQIE